jgi:ribosomal peptide maturation radical SAM protein 1
MMEQNVASFALARRIKDRYPHVAIIFNCQEGGAESAESAAEYVRAFPFIDYWLTESHGAIFTEVLSRLAVGDDAGSVPGVVSLRGDGVSYRSAEMHRPSGGFALPDFDSFYDTARRYGIINDSTDALRSVVQLGPGAIPVMCSTGCWWATKAQCTFCGTSKPGRFYLCRPAEHVLREIDELSKKYGGKRFFLGTLALDVRHVDELFAPLASRNEGYEFTCFTRAGLTRKQICTVARGGLKAAFVGIESLNTHILKLMHKGNTKLQNLNMLRWCAYYGIEMTWNILYGLPGEKPEDYVDQLNTLRLISFLPPPSGYLALRLLRFSPNFNDSELCPTKWRRPVSSYSYLYPEYVDLEKIAYTFEFEPDCELAPREAHDEARAVIAAWRERYYGASRPALTYRREDGDILICDTRSRPDKPRSFALSGLEADIYEACISAPRARAHVCAMLSSQCPGLEIDEDTVSSVCESLCDAGLMIFDAGKCLSLALPAESGL